MRARRRSSHLSSTPRPANGRRAAPARAAIATAPEPVPVLERLLTPDLCRCLAAASAWGFAFSSFYLLPKFLTQELGAGPRSEEHTLNSSHRL